MRDDLKKTALANQVYLVVTTEVVFSKASDYPMTKIRGPGLRVADALMDLDSSVDLPFNDNRKHILSTRSPPGYDDWSH